MLTPKDLARPKGYISHAALVAETGNYDYETQSRWNGNDSNLVKWSTKSSTSWDGESKTNEADS
ncbi:MAG: hypothetical protein HGB36_12995 [Chlorobiaceae bacterium]|nr:hypothetical protein [Chlorobiaceae bacterium]